MAKEKIKLQTQEQQINEILSMRDNWRDKSSSSYNKETIDKALDYIPKIEELVLDQFNIKLFKPDILPGPDGEINLYWEARSYEMLMSVPVEARPATYYGEFNGQEFKGRI
jgi:hypothetical protein